MKKILTSLTITAIIISCNTTEQLHQSGTYTIKERNGDVTKFYEAKSRYNVFFDTLKLNDKMVINVIKTQSFRKNGKMKAI